MKRIAVLALAALPALGQTAQAPILVIPTAANAPGQFGSYYKTDLYVGNAGNAALDVAIYFLPDGTDNTNAVAKSVTVPPDASVRIADAVGFFGATGSGALLLRSSPATGNQPFTATSRTYNTVTAQTCSSIAGATFGVGVPAVEALFGPGVTGLLPDLRNEMTPTGFRTNLGITNASGVTATCLAHIVGENGAVTYDLPFSVPPYSKQQQSIPTTFATGMATFTCATTDPALRWMGWSTAVDDATSDGSFTLMQVAP